MKRKLLPLLLLSLLAALFFALAACGEDGEPASVQSVEITYNGTAVGEDGLTVNLAREAFALDVNVQVTGDCSREATLSSSDTAVASISDTGKTVLLHAAGETVISAAAVADATKTDSFTLTVEPIEPEVVSVAILNENGEAFAGNTYTVDLAEESFAVTVRVDVRGDMTQEYTLTSSDTEIATVGENNVIGLHKTGTAQLTAVAKGDEGVSATLSLTVYDGTPHAISVTGGVAQNAAGETVTTAVYGEEITLMPAAAEEGMEFVAWNLSGASVTVGADGKFVFPGTDMSAEAVFGYIPDNFAVSFPTGGDYNPVNTAGSIEFTYTAVGSHSWNNVGTSISFPETAQNNRFAFTLQNKGAESVAIMLVLGDKATLEETDASGNRLNGDNGYQLNIPAGRTATYVSSYTPGEVRSLTLFIDSTEWDPSIPVTMRSGNIVLSNMAFFTEETPADEPAFRYMSESNQYTFNATQDGFSVQYTTTAWNTYAGVNIYVDNFADLGNFDTLTFKVVNHSATYTANYTVQILADDAGTKIHEIGGTFAAGSDQTYTIEWDTASPVARIVIFIDDMWQPDGTQNVAADGDLTFSAFGLSLSE